MQDEDVGTLNLTSLQCLYIAQLFDVAKRMNPQNFTVQDFILHPFPATSPFPDVKISGQISRRDRGTLSLHYQLEGDLEKLAIPAAIAQPTRKNELWQKTCFECFLGWQNSPQYWEFNLSPSGCWNVYHFTCYREGMEEEKRLISLPFTVRKDNNILTLDLEMNLQAIASGDRVLEIAVATVTKCKNDDIIYWALTHPGSQPDFHRRDSFVLVVGC